MAYILRVRQMAVKIAKAWVEPAGSKDDSTPEVPAGEQAAK
jgi:hypothetical protein